MKSVGVKVVGKPKFHFKSVIVDDSIIYVGSINLIQVVAVRYVPADYVLRFRSEALVDEVVVRFAAEDECEELLS